LSQDCREELVRCSGRQFDPQMIDPFLRVLDELRNLKSLAEAAAHDAAARIDGDRHRHLRMSGDDSLPEYDQTVAVLRAAADRHPPVTSMITEAPAGVDSAMVVVDDDDPSRRAPIGEQMSASHEELALFGGSLVDTCTVDADTWGTWICGVAPIMAGDGALEALVCAAIPALQGAGVGMVPSETALTFASVLRGAVSRTRRSELEAVTDSLTGLYNHRYFQERLLALDAGADPRMPFSLLFCDLDLFKRLNDAQGHRAGDAALCRTGQLLQQAIRAGDTVARYGGDEFALLLLGSERDAALAVAERIRARVAQEFPEGESPGLTVSIGIAEYPADARSPGDLIDLADVAMYAAKRRGRDRSVAYEPAMRTPDAESARDTSRP
jgi:diguanylate cyclase (GGDEF)-like protein